MEKFLKKPVTYLSLFDSIVINSYLDGSAIALDVSWKQTIFLLVSKYVINFQEFLTVGHGTILPTRILKTDPIFSFGGF